MNQTNNGINNKVRMFFFPYRLGGHLLPMVDAARFFASHPDVQVTIITTSKNVKLFQNAIDRDREAGHDIGFHTMELPLAEVGLPEDAESGNCNSVEVRTKLFMAVFKLKDPLLDLLRTDRPDCLVSDMFHPWTVEIAHEVGIPRIEFHIHGLFALSAEDSLKRFKPHENVTTDTEPFLLTGLPDEVEFTRPRLPDWYRAQTAYGGFLDMVQEAEERSYGVIVNSFYDLESSYADYFRNVAGRRIWVIGPVSQYSNKNSNDKAERGGKNAQDGKSTLDWLDSKEQHSVIYVSFGSQADMSKEQFHEIAYGLEASGHPFIWVARSTLSVEQGNLEGWLPEGFQERMSKSNQGLIIKGWAPQLLILGHANVGAFMTHCGWNSTIEGLSNGLPLITWPLGAEQFFNESLVVDVLKIGIRVGNEEWMNSQAQPKVTVTRAKVETAVRQMMGGGEEVEEMRRKVKKFGEKSKVAVQEGGSSQRDVYALVEELKARKRAAHVIA